MPTIGLAMIVKDEAPVITRALDSARPLIDYALVCDTGSTDGTQEIVANWLNSNNVPGDVIEEPWQNFGYNRSFVLSKLREIDVDYALMFEADELLQLKSDPVALKQNLTADCYYLDLHLGSIVYPMPRLTSNYLPFFYRGIIHEWLTCKKNSFSRAPLADIEILSIGGGVRSRDPDRYRHDAELIEATLSRDDLDPFERTRYTFYLAQSWRDCGEHRRALDAYEKRIALGGWPEEVYVSLLNAARLREQLKQPLPEIIATYRQAISVNPKRAEAFHGAARILRLAGFHHEAYDIANQGVRLPLHNGLFVETRVYQYGLLDEFSICAYWAGHRTESWLACQMLLRDPMLDDRTRQRIERNASFIQ